MDPWCWRKENVNDYSRHGGMSNGVAQSERDGRSGPRTAWSAGGVRDRAGGGRAAGGGLDEASVRVREDKHTLAGDSVASARLFSSRNPNQFAVESAVAAASVSKET